MKITGPYWYLYLLLSCIGYCVFVDAEHALDPSLAEAIGVNTQNLLLSQPDCGEQALSLVDTLIRSGSVDVVVVDSVRWHSSLISHAGANRLTSILIALNIQTSPQVAALVPKGELDGEMGDAHMAMQARLMSQALRKLSHSLSLSQTILIFTNQVLAWSLNVVACFMPYDFVYSDWPTLYFIHGKLCSCLDHTFSDDYISTFSFVSFSTCFAYISILCFAFCFSTLQCFFSYLGHGVRSKATCMLYCCIYVVIFLSFLLNISVHIVGYEPKN